MIMSFDKKENKHELNKNNLIISSVDSVKLLGIEIDMKLNFEKHVLTIFKKASRHLNAKSRVQRYIGKKEKNTIIKSFVCILSLHALLASMTFLF